jgi:N-methylhydantoinase A/oxoprolinase/acetone carboxylase beta subunit
MEFAVVGCSIFKNEIEYLKPRITSALDFYWLPQRLHSKPLELRRLIQAEIDRADGAGKTYDGIVLLYGLCSKGTIGVSSRKYPVAVPKVQDCIGVLLGSNERYMAHFREKPGTYWFTKGWFETGFNPGKRSRPGRSTTDRSKAVRPPGDGVLDFYRERYLEYRKKFGEETSRYLIEEWDQRWIGNYTTLAFIDWGMKENLGLKKRAEESAGNLRLEFEDIPGDPSLLLSLLNGEWAGRDAENAAGGPSADSVLVAPPGRRVMPTYDMNVLTCSEAAGEKTQGERKQGPGRGGRSGIGLGIDAGGTYTDTVIYDFSGERVIASAKALTTHDDYSVGIAASLRELLGMVDGDIPSKVGLVSLSTTVATNAIVEGKGGSVGIILIGYDASTARKIEFQPQIVIGGRHDIHGAVIEPLDDGEAMRAVRALLEKGVDAIAVSSEVGVRNPAFELRVRDLIREISPLPVVCGSELTAELNCVKRANTCFFNARLIPLVSGLLNSVKKVLGEKEIRAPIMVVKGDGTLMGEDVARKNPVEMVLSGPAASVIGGLYLSGVQDGYVVDMGGTTTDVALVKGGFVSYKEDGVHISGFKTAVRTVNVYTFGLGGDSYVRYESRGGRFTIGPERVIPLSCLARSEPRVLADLAARPAETRGEEMLVQPADYFVFQKDIRGSQVHPQEKAIVDVLKRHGPMSRPELAARVKAASVALLRTERLEMFGNVLRSALTPTDLLHAAGKLSFWDSEAAGRAVALYARRAGMSEKRLMEEVFKEFYRKLLYHLFEFWFTEDGRLSGETIFSQDLASHLFFENKDVHLGVKADKPLVFIGAPAHEYAEGLKRYIDLTVAVPVYHDVANAVGAITGAIREDVRILIRPHIEGGYVAYTQEEMKHYETLSEAKREMAEHARLSAARKARENGALSLNVDVKVEDKEVKVSENDTIYLETVITATVASIPIMKT